MYRHCRQAICHGIGSAHSGFTHLAKSIIAEITVSVKYLCKIFICSWLCRSTQLILSPISRFPLWGTGRGFLFFLGSTATAKGGTQRTPQEAADGKPEGGTAVQERHRGSRKRRQPQHQDEERRTAAQPSGAKRRKATGADAYEPKTQGAGLPQLRGTHILKYMLQLHLHQRQRAEILLYLIDATLFRQKMIYEVY